MAKLKLLLCLGCFVLVFSYAFAQERKDEFHRCEISSQSKAKFRLASIGRSLDKPFITGMRIVLNKNSFNKEYMLRLAQRIKTEYCREEIISVTIFDDYKAATSARVVAEHLAGTQIAPEIRGFYSLNRKTGEEGIEFSTERGKPTGEVEINLKGKN